MNLSRKLSIINLASNKDSALKKNSKYDKQKLKTGELPVLVKYPPEVWKTRKFDDVQLRYCSALYNQKTDGQKNASPPFHKKYNHGIAKNYRSITLNSIAAKIYNGLPLNCIEPEIEKILTKNQHGFRRNRSTTSQIPISSVSNYRLLNELAGNLNST